MKEVEVASLISLDRRHVVGRHPVTDLAEVSRYKWMNVNQVINNIKYRDDWFEYGYELKMIRFWRRYKPKCIAE